MDQPGLDRRHRDKDGEISRKHGNTLVSTLRKLYGAGFATEFPPTMKLADVLAATHTRTLSEFHRAQLHRDHDAGVLAERIGKQG